MPDEQEAAEPMAPEDAEGDSVEPEAPTAAEAEDDVAQGQAPAEELPPDVYEVLRVCLGLLLQQGWVHLGLQAYPGTTQAVMDLPKARVAIDSAGLVYEQLRGVLGGEERRELELMLTNLRVNFARRAEAG